jgi:hypothetical protein
MSIFADLAAHKTSEVYSVNDLDTRDDRDFGSLTTPAKSAEIRDLSRDVSEGNL